MEQIYIYVIVGIIVVVIIIAWWYFSQGGTIGTPNEPSNWEQLTKTWEQWWTTKQFDVKVDDINVYHTTDGGDVFYWALIGSQIYISTSKQNVIDYLTTA